MRKMTLIVVILLFALVTGAPAEEVVLTGSLEYIPTNTGIRETDHLVVSIPNDAHAEAPVFSEDSVREATALYNTVVGLTRATEAYFADLIQHCDDVVASTEIDCANTPDGLTCEEYVAQELEIVRLECLGSAEIEPDVVGGLEVLDALTAYLEDESLELSLGALDAELQLVAEIADTMAEAGTAPPHDSGGVGSPWSGPGGGGGLGATPGGAQDFGYIRSVVDAGFVPLPFHFPLEGLLAEHDLPIDETEPCHQLLCIRTSTAVAPLFGSNDVRTFVQFGYSSGLDPETFQRAPLNLAVVVDVSGSMGDWTGQETSKMEAVKEALLTMVDRLSEHDRLAIVLFNSSPWVLLESTPVTDSEAIEYLINTIHAGGSTNIEAGLARGFEIVAEFSEPELRSDRVMLFTDALPNTGFTGEGSFLNLATTYADLGIGLTTFGVGFNFGQELVVEISRIRDGAYFFLETSERIQEIFELDFDYLVTPLAYDLQLDLAPGLRFDLVSDAALSTEVPTVFLSRNRGATVFVLERDPEAFDRVEANRDSARQ